MDPFELKNIILEKLKTVMDPETNVDVIRMKLVQSLEVDNNGKVACTFRPSSPLCPIAVTLAMNITQAIGEVPGVTGQSITVVDYVGADLLNEILNSTLKEKYEQG